MNVLTKNRGVNPGSQSPYEPHWGFRIRRTELTIRKLTALDLINLSLWNWVYLCCAPLDWLFSSFFPSSADRRGNLYKGKPNPRGPNRIRRSGGTISLCRCHRHNESGLQRMSEQNRRDSLQGTLRFSNSGRRKGVRLAFLRHTADRASWAAKDFSTTVERLDAAV